MYTLSEHADWVFNFNILSYKRRVATTQPPDITQTCLLSSILQNKQSFCSCLTLIRLVIVSYFSLVDSVELANYTADEIMFNTPPSS